MSANGRVVIPVMARKRLHLEPGEELLLSVEGDELRLRSVRVAVAEAQAAVRRYVKSGERLSDELIKDRRREAGRD